MRASASSLWIVQFVKMNGCGRVSLICAFSCESSVSEVSDWIVEAERPCSRAPRIQRSKLQDRRGWRGAERELIPRFTAAALMAHGSQEGRTTNSRESREVPAPENRVEVGTIDGESEGNLANAMPAVLHKTTVKHGAAIWS